MTLVITGELPAPILTWREERSRLGLNRFDEVWDGVLHMVPGPSGGHADVDASVILAIGPLARAAGLRVRTTTNIGSADDYRIPDAMLVRTRGTGIYTDTAALVVEVLSPDDETPSSASTRCAVWTRCSCRPGDAPGAVVAAAGRRLRRDRAQRAPGDHC